MKKIFRTMVTVALIAVMTVTCLPFTAFADVGDYQFNERESNNTISLADTVYDDYTVFGTCGYNDIDYFKLYVSATSTVRITLVGDNAHLMMGFCDSTGEALTAVRTAYSDGSYGAVLTYSVYSGTYYIGLVNDSGYSNGYGFYVEVIRNSTHTHSYSSRVTPATCQSQGYTTYTCSCGDSYTANYTSIGSHASNTWIVETPATCTVNGYRYKECDTCGTSFGGETIYASHNPADWVVYEKPTATSTGTLAKVCLDCGEPAESFSITLGLNNTNGMIIFVTDNGQLVYNNWAYWGGAWYYFDSNGMAKTNAWITAQNGICYVDATGKMAANRWILSNGKWYYFNSGGYMVKDAWRKDSKGWVYLGADGAMKTNAWVTDSKGWCYVGANGYAVTNCWKKDSRGWIYLNSSGSMTKSKWVKDGGKWYYCDANGYMVANTTMTINGKKYGFDSSGVMVTNKWIKDSGRWMYFDSYGLVVKSKWFKDGGKWYYFDANGYMVTSKWMKDSKGWVYLGADGAMKTNAWVTDSKGWCYVGANGYAVTNCWKKDSKGWIYLNSSGSMTKSKWIKDGGYWYYLDADGYMVTDTWEKDGSKWRYINSSGHMASHKLDYHSHSFSAATYTERQKCSCGAERGEAKDLPLYLEGEAPFYCWADDYNQVKITNLYYRVSEGILIIYFDVEGYRSNSTYYDWFGAEFKLYDGYGYLIDDSTWLDDGIDLGEKKRGEYVYLYLNTWDGYSDLTLSIGDYS